MSLVQDILTRKGAQVMTVGPDVNVLDAAQLMNEHKIGALLVVVDQRILGIFTERDVLRRIVAEERAPAQTRVGDVMTNEVVVCKLQTNLDEARGAMKNRRIRHMPVVDDNGILIGLISIGDLNAFDAHNKEVTIHFLEEYIHGRV
jgi:CBS domain-containing protein